MQEVPPIEEAKKIPRSGYRRSWRWCSTLCIIIAMGVLLFLTVATVLGMIAEAVGNGKNILSYCVFRSLANIAN